MPPRTSGSSARSTMGRLRSTFSSARAIGPTWCSWTSTCRSLDGFEATRRIMETQPLPIIICTATADPQRAGGHLPLHGGGRRRLRGKAGRPRPRLRGAAAEPPANRAPDVRSQSRAALEPVSALPPMPHRWRNRTSRAAAGPASDSSGIGASTGGPPVLQTILSGLPKDFPVPLLIVQHIAPRFSAAAWWSG